MVKIIVSNIPIILLHKQIVKCCRCSSDVFVCVVEILKVYSPVCVVNRPFPNYLWPLFQSEPRYSSILMKISFHLHLNENLCSYEMLSTRKRFEKEAQGNPEMAQNFGLDLFLPSNLPGSFICSSV